MSQSRLLSLSGCLLAIVACVSDAGAQGGPHRGAARSVPAGYVPKHQRVEHEAAHLGAEALGNVHRVQYENEGLAPVPMGGAVAGPQMEMHDDGMEWQHEHGGDACGPDGCECDCGVPGCRGCGLRIYGGMVNRTEYYSGVSSFSSSVNRGGTGSFGFEGGLNMGTPLFGGWRGLGFQLGAGATSSNFNGANFTRDDRGQVFVTMGLFRRVDWGLQGGLVVDHLHDEWYGNVDLSQVRGEFSWMFPEGTEAGIWFAASNDDDIVEGQLQAGTNLPTTIRETWQINDLCAFFIRQQLCDGEARLFAGCTGTNDGLLGGDITLPVNHAWSLRSGFTYVLPEEGPLSNGHAREAWNASVLLVWQPCGRGCGKDYYRPLFNVANNGSMIVER